MWCDNFIDSNFRYSVLQAVRYRFLPTLFLFSISFYTSVYSQTATQNKLKDADPKPLASCSDLGGENGWSAWQAAEGYHKLGIPDPVYFAPIAPVAPRFNITTGAGVDACTQGTAGPTIPLVCPGPGFGNSSIQLGEPNTNGMEIGKQCYNAGVYPGPGIGAAGNGCSEQLRFPLTVSAQDTHFVYAYAIVVENPFGGHTMDQAPFAEIYILDQNNDTVPCSHQKYMADLNGGVSAGFFAASCLGSTPTGYPNNGMIVSYKPWTYESINLTNYVGQNLTVVINNSDCALGGHYCYSYWDFKCSTIPVTPVYYCVGQPVTLTAPVDSVITYTYQWYQNGNPYTGPPSGTSQTITPTPNPGDTFAVQLVQPTGCNFTIPFVPVPMDITPDFDFAATGGCNSGMVNFFDSTTTLGNVPIVNWNWSFPGGTPATSTQQNPTNISYPPGNYTVTLVVVSQDGCTDSIDYPVTIPSGPPPVAQAASVPVCFNNSTQFSDLSVGSPAQWSWDFGDGNSSTQPNPGHTYAAPGTYTVTLNITDSAGCTDSVTITTIVNPLPAPAFTSPVVCLGDSTCFTDQSTISGGAITTWGWNFGDPGSGASNTSTAQNPCHIYTTPGSFTVTLTVTSDSGCQNTLMLPADVNPAPIASFTTQNACLNSSTQFTDGSTPAPNDPITTWDWNYGDGSANGTAQNPSHLYTSSGTYTVTLIVTSAAGCRDTIDNPVTLYQPPVANFVAPDSGCAPVCINYNDMSTSVDGAINNWQWTFPGASPLTSTAASPQNICYNTPGSYSVSLLVTTQYGCTDSITLPMANIFPWPKAEFCVSPLIAPVTDPVFTFCDQWSSDVISWSWDFGDGNSDVVSTDPTHSYSATATQNDFYSYQICIRVENAPGCWDTTCKTVELIPEFQFYIPNTFTPNADGMNEFFYGKCRGVKEYNIWLFDRWGNQIWDCHVQDKNTNWDSDATIPKQEGLASKCKWDGVVVQGGMDMNGSSRQLAQEDVYVWKVRLTDIFDRKHSYVGHVNIVR